LEDGTFCELKVATGDGRMLMWVSAKQLPDLEGRGLVLRKYDVPLGSRREHEELMKLLGAADERTRTYFTTLVTLAHSWGVRASS
jgi:hypothetical protein